MEAVLNLIREICHLHRERRNYVFDAVQSLKNRGFGDVSYKFVEAIHNQLLREVENLMKLSRERVENALYWTIDMRANFFGIWSERYLLICDYDCSDSDYYDIEVIDTFNDKSMHVKFSMDEKCGSDIYFCGLDQGFGLIVDSSKDTGADRNHLVRFVQLDFHAKVFRTLSAIGCYCDYVKIVVDREEPTKFALILLGEDDGISAKICYINKTKIVAGKLIEMDFKCKCYSDGFLYGVKSVRNDDLGMVSEISIYDVEQESLERLNVALPKDYIMDNEWMDIFEFIGGRFFGFLRHVHGVRVAAYVDLQLRQWVLLDFSFKFGICRTVMFNLNHLVVCTFGEASSGRQFRFHKLTMRKPELLQNIAWFTLIKYMKKVNHPKGPYEAARKYLPYNSQIRCPFVKPDKNEEKGPAKKRVKRE